MLIGEIYQEEIIITSDSIQKFAEFSGDFNPIHFDDNAAIKAGFNARIAHGMISASFFSKIIANSFPGPGAIYLSQSLKFHAPVYINEKLTYRLEALSKHERHPIYTIKTECFGPDGKLKISGEATIKAKE
jgi:3-hydroxybutyryl-CoA dehydratase